MGLYIAGRIKSKATIPVHISNELLLGGKTWLGDSWRMAILIGSSRSYNSTDHISVSDSIIKHLQNNHNYAFSSSIPVRTVVETVT